MQAKGAITKFMNDLFCEDGVVSLTRVLTGMYFMLFAAVTIYLVLMDQVWSCYDVFATLAGGAGVAGQVSNKFINSKYNTAPGRFDCASMPPRGADRP